MSEASVTIDPAVSVSLEAVESQQNGNHLLPLAPVPPTGLVYPEGGPKNPLEHPASVPHVWIGDAEAGVVQVAPKRTKVAIVGFASSCRDLAPYGSAEWEVWGLNQLYRYIPRFDRWFEMHGAPAPDGRRMYETDIVRDTDYVGWLKACPRPIYMSHRQPDIPTSVRFPLERAIELGGRDYFTSTPAYMVALALLEGFEEIGVWGIDLVVGGEYFYQKPCMEFWLGVAQARGVKVTLPTQTALCRQSHRYGYQMEPDFGPLKRSMFETRRKAFLDKRNELLTQINAIEGALTELNYWDGLLDLAEKGATIA